MTQMESLTKTGDPYRLLKVFESAGDLPTLPEVAVRLQQVVDDPHSGAYDVARVIEDDPAIATRVLRVVNSVFYAPRQGMEITEIGPAVTRLGLLAVTNIAMSTSIFQAFARVQQPVFDRREFWRHSVSVGIVGSVLHDFCGEGLGQTVTRDAVHLAGIVHDIGKILFERYANQEFHKAIRSARAADLETLKEEKRLLGLGHEEAGAWLGQKWNLDAPIQAVIRWHHEPLECPDPALRGLVKLVHMADYICHNQALGQSGNHSPTYDNRVLDELGLTPERIAEVIAVVEVEAANSEILLSLNDS